MKLFLIFEDKEVLIDSPCDISVKTLIKQVSSHLSINSEKLILMNEKEVLDDTFVICKDDSMKKFILIKPIEGAVNNFASDEDQFDLDDGNNLEELIMKVTGAKLKLSSKKTKFKNKHSSLEKKLEIMNQIFSRNSLPRSSHFLQQEFESLIAQTNNIRENIFNEEHILNSNNNNSSSNNNQLSFNPFVRNQNNLFLRTLRYHMDEGNIQGQSTNSNNNNVRQNYFNNLNTFIPQINPFRRMNVQPDLQLIKNLVDMGFSEDQAKRALSLTGNNLNAAADLILSNENLEELSNPIGYSQSFRVPNQQSVSRIPGYSLIINNNTSNNNNETNSSSNLLNNNNIPNNSVSSSVNNNNINIESNSNLSILNNLVINNTNLINDDSNYSYQEESQNIQDDELMEFDVNSESKNNEDI